jgi:hypothetical protein
MTVNMEISMITPPVGLNLFVGSVISGLSLIRITEIPGQANTAPNHSFESKTDPGPLQPLAKTDKSVYKAAVDLHNEQPKNLSWRERLQCR